MIKAGMTVAEAILQLTRGFRKIMGRNPDGLEKIKIQQEAIQRLKELEKVVDMQGRFLDPSKTIMGGTQEGAALRSGIMKATNSKPKPVTSLDDPIKKVYESEKKAGKFENIRLKDGRKIESEEDFREYIDELNEDSNFATGGRAGFSKGSGLKTLFDFLNKKSPAKAYTDYLKSIKDRMKAGKEAEVAGEVIPIAATGALITNQVKKKLKAMNEEQKKEFKKDMEKKANGGRAGFDNGGAPSIKYDFDKEQEPMGPTFETNDPEEALKEIVRRMINVEPAKIPLSKDMMLMFDLDRAKIGGSKDIGGGQLNFGINKGFGRDDTGIGFEFRKQFASGGITALKSLLNFFAKQRGTKGSQQLKDINPKSVPSGIMNIMGPEHRKMLERNQTDYLESLLDTIKSDKKFLDKNKEIAKQVQKDIDKAGFGDFTTAEEMLQPFIKNAMKGDTLDRMKVYDKINVDDAIMDIEQMIKNRRMRESDGRALNATGGRIGFKDGMTRRTFLKLLGGMAAIPIVGKFLKPLKTAKGVKKVPMIATDNVPGKPEWFDQLVNKVILEGDDVTKKFATGERQSIHQKTLDDGSVVRVTEDTDQGAVRVEYESEANVFGDDVLMEYKKPLPDEGDPRPAAEFSTAESGPVGRQQGPDDFDIDVDEVGGSSISDLDSDVSKLKEFATGQKPTMKELVKNIERRKKAQRITEDPEAQSDALIRRQGEAIDYDDYASGGIARMLGE